jgi:hypothetical protein
MNVVSHGLDWGSVPDWFQAFGAVAALWFVVIQVTRDGRAERRRDLARLMVAHKALNTAGATLEQVRDKFEGDPNQLRTSTWALANANLFPAMLKQLEDVQLEAIGDPEAVEVIMAAKALFAAGARDVQWGAEGKPHHQDFVAHTLSRLDPLEARMAASVKRAEGRGPLLRWIWP